MTIQEVSKRIVQYVILRFGYVFCRDKLRRLAGRNPVTFLCYHLIDPGNHPNSVHPVTFRRQLDRLQKHFDILGVEDAVGALQVPQTLRKPACCLTFDDGYSANYSYALPILRELSSTATFFLATSYINGGLPFPDDKRRGLLGFLPLSWNQTIELMSEGHTVGSHTVTHADCGIYRNLGELRPSKEILESRTGSPILYFAFPFGQKKNIHSASGLELKRAGYRVGFSCFGGVNFQSGKKRIGEEDTAPIYNRIHISNSDSLIGFEFQVRCQEVVLFGMTLREKLKRLIYHSGRSKRG